MTEIPKITEADIMHWTNSAYFQRGQNYYRMGAIYNQLRQGMAIKSQCSGSYQDFYRQEVEFNEKGILSADCSCPVGDGGYCKHAIALLLTWVNDPDSFAELEALDRSLEQRSKEELIALIKEMLGQAPELSSLLDLPLLAKSNEPIDLGAIRRQAEHALQNHDYEWGYAREIKKSLNPLLNIASTYLTCGDSKNAADINMIVIETILDNKDTALGDEDGALLGVLYDCSEALGQCLELMDDEVQRHDILQILFCNYRWDVFSAGGVGAADCVPDILVQQTTPDERAEVAGWTRKILPSGDSWSDGYHREVLGRLLLELEADILDDEAYLGICRETGRLNDLIARLLKLKRIDEAKDAARNAKDYDLLIALGIFEQQGQRELAIKLVEERIARIEDSRLIEWLSKRYEENGNLVGALALEEWLFWKHPCLDEYEKLVNLAQQMDKMDALRAKIIAWLESEEKFYLLVEIYLHEGDVKNALTALERIRSHWGIEELRFTVSKAAKESYPQDTIRILMKDIENFINRRGRDNYAEAAQRLYEVRATYQYLKDIKTWDKLIASLREEYKRLPALQDELNKMKL